MQVGGRGGRGGGSVLIWFGFMRRPGNRDTHTQVWLAQHIARIGAPDSHSSYWYPAGEGSPQQGDGSPQQREGSPQQGDGSPQQREGSPQQRDGSPQPGEGSPQPGDGESPTR